MPTGAQRVILASSVKRFAAAIIEALATQSSAEHFETDEIGPIAREALAELASALKTLEASETNDGVLFAPDNRAAALIMSFLAERQAQAPVAQALFETELARDDLAGWVAQFVPAWLKGRALKHAFVAPSQRVVEVPNQLRVAVLGDWGSGLYGAPISAATIQLAVPRFDFVVHLGDVYYAGTETEVTERFLNLWPELPGASSWALNSNHEMFSGGAGYFDKTLRDPRFSGQAGSSCFAWENDHFLFVGLDTAYEDRTIGGLQRAWLAERASAAAGKKLVLFSHHQPFSAFQSAGTELVSALSDLLTAGRVAAWYWGHEHRCVFFERHARWSLWGRCVGHGGYPQTRDVFDGPAESTNCDGSSWRQVARAGVPNGWALDGPNPYVIGHSEKYAPHGFVSLCFDGPAIRETVHAPDGSLLLAHEAR